MDIKKIISQMTLEEKASMCSGKNIWETRDIERLSIPSITFADGPYGVVKRRAGFSDAIPATCFPTSSAMASSWDTDLIYSIGKAIGEECQAEGVGVLLGPGVNIQRSPLGGRNFEYYSEDPILSGEMGAAFVNGVQSQGIGACVKHYAANNQEYHRFSINEIIDERTLMEIYLTNFERVVKKSKPYVVMAAYNKINGVYCTENRYLLTDILRREWEFDGFTVSDWYAVDSIVNSLKAGLDLEMPYSHGVSAKNIIKAVLNGNLDESILDDAIESILNIVFKVVQNEKVGFTYSKEEHNLLAREAASNCVVLLKNESNILPLKKEKLKKIAVIGEYAKNPRYQGGGSAFVTPTMIENGYDEIIKLVGDSIKVYYARGYNSEKDTSAQEYYPLVKEAKNVAKLSDVAILFVGTPKDYDEEGHDRTNINLPANQIRLIQEISKVQENIIVVLSNGSPVIFSPWYGCAKAILEGWLTGQASGGAIADILFGVSNPSGKLSSTFPIQLPDNPTYLDYVDIEDNLQYKEGIFVGYRYYDKKNMEVEFPFGFGLSYTSFQYSHLKLSRDVINNGDILKVSLKVKNIGIYFGKEVVQLYVGAVLKNIERPIKELRGFAKVSLYPGEEKEIIFTLSIRDFSFYDVVTKDWVTEGGPFKILIGKSSRDICLTGNIYVKSSFIPVINYTRDTLIEKFLSNPNTKLIADSLLNNLVQSIGADEKNIKSIIESFKKMPISRFLTISNINFTDEMLDQLLNLANKKG